MKISYISNIPKNTSSGGGSGVNTAVYKYFQERATYFNYQYINPPSNKIEKHKSRFQKLIGAPRNYFFFSEKRLKRIKEEFNFDQNADFYFFHGFTPWIKTKPDKPYFCFNDACFATYLNMYNSKQYSKNDLSRIYLQEANWLKNAKKVFFRSNWALEETKKLYNLKGDNFVNVRRGGFVDIPEKDNYEMGEKIILLYISNMFYRKGGDIVVDSFNQIRKDLGKKVELFIIGEKPKKNELLNPGVTYKGYFNKAIPNENKTLLEIFTNASLLLHPTNADTNPLVISELNYFGCPAIASNKFAIPELIEDGQTGYLLVDNNDANELAEKTIHLLSHKEKYLLMRKNCRNKALEEQTWEIVLECIKKHILEFTHV